MGAFSPAPSSPHVLETEGALERKESLFGFVLIAALRLRRVATPLLKLLGKKFCHIICGQFGV